MPVARTRSELLKKRLDPFTRVLDAVGQGDVAALHGARVASRRLRELLPVLQLPGETARKTNKRLKKVTGRLGAVRELDVMLLLIDELHVTGRQATALARVGVSVAKSRDDARKRLVSKLPLAGMRKLAQKLERVVEDLRAAESESSRVAARNWRLAVDAQTASRASRLLSAMADAGAMYLPERLHAVRIAVKKLRYALELSNDLADEKRSADLRVFKRIQDLLGRLHDLQVLIERVRKVQGSLAPPNLTVWRDLDALTLTLEDDCRRLHARYMRQRDRVAAVAEALSAPPPEAEAASRPHTTRRVG
jgi:CHAD domain-containing protein